MTKTIDFITERTNTLAAVTRAIAAMRSELYALETKAATLIGELDASLQTSQTSTRIEFINENSLRLVDITLAIAAQQSIECCDRGAIDRLVNEHRSIASALEQAYTSTDEQFDEYDMN